VTMNPFSLTLGLSPSPYTQALFDGSVRPKNVDLRLQSQFGTGLDNIGARHRAIIAGEIDGGELSISSFILARLRGIPLLALPVFLSRRFRLRCMYCRKDSPIGHPSELAGKKVTVHRYNATTPVWLKGILQNEFGVKPQEIEWYVAEPDIAEESLRPPPPDVRVNFISPPRTREHAIELVERGEIEAALEPYHLHENPKMRYLMRDFRRAEEVFFRRTGAYTLNHLFAIREDVAKDSPWAVKDLFSALNEANSLADRYRDEKQKSEAAWERQVMGEDFAYSLTRGCARRSVETLLEYQVQQGILDKKPAIEDLFVPEMLQI
jgi:4,5-dihydroxyphthalate decarboxylase